jgi:hypothetical protein
MHTDQYGTKHLRSNEAFETVSLQVEVHPSSAGGSARILFKERTGKLRYAFELGAEMVDELIEAIAPILTSRNANWENMWVRTPNPQHRPGE